uniref:Ceramide synthase 1 n=1 Tax=Leptobrachium leishanense TaxID=445787 RepID=A0A8C5QLJ3_9ANUR
MELDHKIHNLGLSPALGYLELLQLSGDRFLNSLTECMDCGLELSWNTLQTHARVSWVEVLCLLLCTLAWTFLRKISSTWIFQPFAEWCLLEPKEANKCPESAWKLFFYSFSWSYSIYLLFFTEYTFFQDPSSVFHGWTSGMEVPGNIAVAYLIQSSFYAHSIYATIYMDAWRKDSIVMMLHHLVTFALITFSYAFRYHNVGILVFFLHDVNDVQLEFTKLNVYFKMRGGKYHRVNDVISDIGCVVFSVSWFWFRLYWFPQKVLFATCYSSLEIVPNIPFYLFFNVLLFALTAMNIYWFMYIVIFVGKVLTGHMQEINDVREYDDDIDADGKSNGFPANSKKTQHKEVLRNG